MNFSWLMCHESLAKLDAYLDRELAPDEMRAVEIHLKICAHCAEKFRFERGFRRGLREKIAHIEAPQALLEEILGNLPRDVKPLEKK